MLLASLYAMPSSKTKISWMREMLKSPQVLRFLVLESLLTLETHDSGVTIVKVHSQKKEDQMFDPFQYSIRTIEVTERLYSPCEREVLAVIFAVQNSACISSRVIHLY